jgi:hypothetical protein
MSGQALDLARGQLQIEYAQLIDCGVHPGDQALATGKRLRLLPLYEHRARGRRQYLTDPNQRREVWLALAGGIIGVPSLAQPGAARHLRVGEPKLPGTFPYPPSEQLHLNSLFISVRPLSTNLLFANK